MGARARARGGEEGPKALLFCVRMRRVAEGFGKNLDGWLSLRVRGMGPKRFGFLGNRRKARPSSLARSPESPCLGFPKTACSVSPYTFSA